MDSICKVCYRVGSVSLSVGAGCGGCRSRTTKSCENCEDSSATTQPCCHCYSDRNFRWAALKTFETGTVPSRFGRKEFCEDCLSFLCDCGASDYEEAIFEYLEQVAPDWVRPTEGATATAEESEEAWDIDLKAWTLQQIEEFAWRASFDGPHPLRLDLGHQIVIKGVSFCKQCWRPACSTASGCYCTGLKACSCPSDPDAEKETKANTCPCPTCWPDGALRHGLAMDFMQAKNVSPV